MECWICREKGNTGEHLIKASDLRSYFGDISQKMPLYFHTSEKKNIPIGSLKSKRLKSDALICNKCNSARTQQYDKAWKSLSIYLRSNWPQVHKSRKVKLADVFPGSIRESMLYVHLYFVKLFGCRIVESGAPIEIVTFSEALLNQKSHKDIYIAFGQRPGKVEHKYAGIIPIQSIDINGTSVFATWLYMIDQLAVNIIFAPKYKHPNVLKDTWHPRKPKKVIAIKAFRT